MRRLALAYTALCLLGIAASVELTRIHLFVHTDPSYHSVCAVSEGVNCETVAISPFSVFAGLPVSVWGLLGYLALAALALWGWGERRLHPMWPWGLVGGLSLFSVAVSAVLAFISATRIDSLCLFCMTSYGINLALLALCVVGWRRSRLRVSELVLLDLRALAARPRLTVALGLSGVVALAALEALVPAYWQTPGWADLPELPSGADADGHPWIGAAEPTVTIVEFSDYECPHCRAAHKTVRVLAARHPDRVRLVHRHLPLDQACHPGLRRPFHSRACLFAAAAECAGLQERFWEMNDALFSIQDRVKTADVDPLELAVRLGLDRAGFERCLDGQATRARIAGDVREAMAKKIQGTPTFFVGEKRYTGGIPAAELERLIRDE